MDHRHGSLILVPHTCRNLYTPTSDEERQNYLPLPYYISYFSRVNTQSF